MLSTENKVFERSPLLGVLVGLTALGAGLFFSISFYQERRHFGDRPTIVNTESAIAYPDANASDWVELKGDLIFNCSARIETENLFELRLLFGRVDTTYLLATAGNGSRTLVLEISGEASCKDFEQRPRVGTLSTPSGSVIGFFESRNIGLKRPVLIFCFTCGPEQTEEYLVGTILLSFAGLWLTVYYLRKWAHAST